MSVEQEMEKLMEDYVKGKIDDLNEEVFKRLLADIVDKSSKPVDAETLRFYLVTETELPSSYEKIDKIFNIYNTMGDVFKVGSECFGIVQKIQQLDECVPNSEKYRDIVGKVTSSSLKVASKVSSYIPVIGGFISMEMDIAGVLFNEGLNIVNQHIKELNDLAAQIEAELNDTSVEEEKLKQYMSQLSPDSDKYKALKQAYDEYLNTKETISKFLSVCASEEEQRRFDEACNSSQLEEEVKSTYEKIDNLMAEYNDLYDQKIQPDKDNVENSEHVRPIDPLVVDLNKNKKYAGDIQNGTHFDSGNDGFKEKTAWIEKGDGLLVRDINKNGTIDSGEELFGDTMPLEDGSYAKDGFSALASFDSNEDRKINADDALFGELGIWIDENGDGITQEGEIKSLEELKVKEIDLNSRKLNQTDEYGNSITAESTLVMEDGSEYTIGEVHFQTDRMDVVQTNPVEIADEIKNTMPELKASGPMLTLQQAMTIDEALKDMVTEFINCKEPEGRKKLAEEILAKWTGCENIEAGSRGNYVDASHLAIIEKLMGDSFSGVSGAIPNNQAGPILERVYSEMVSDMECKLLAQTQLLTYMLVTSVVQDEETGKEKTDYSRAVAMFDKLAGENIVT